MFFLGLNIVYGLRCTLEPKKTLKPFKTLKLIELKKNFLNFPPNLSFCTTL